MKIKYKITIGMVCLLAILFSIGSTVFISTTFNNSIKREHESARNSYQMIINTIQLLNHIESWQSAEGAVNEIRPMLEQDSQRWEGIRMESASKVLYESGEIPLQYEVTELPSDRTADKLEISEFKDSKDNRYLLLSGTFSVGKESINLDLSKDISDVYSQRDSQMDTFKLIFVILIIICAVLTFLFSWLLTRPLTKLSETAKLIAEGNYSSRSGINTNDEVGLVSAEFDNMAEQTERNIEDLKAAFERQERFMGYFTHEIKTPMSSILGYSELLRRNDLTDDEQTEAVNFIHSEGKRLENLSLKMLDIFIAQNETIIRRRLDIKKEIQQIADSLKFSFGEKDIQINIDIFEGQFPVDAVLFKSLITNLISNAANAIDKRGKIEIKGSICGKNLKLIIQDDGRGIEKKDLDHISEIFYRVDKSRSRKHGGAGLGLALCTKIIELHRGEMSIESKVGEGTTVTIILEKQEDFENKVDIDGKK